MQDLLTCRFGSNVCASGIKFAMAWIIYPVIKIGEIMCKPMRRLNKTCLMPFEPIMELFSHCCPHVGFSLFSTGSGEGDNNPIRSQEEIVEKATSSENDPGRDHGATVSERVVYGSEP